MESKKSYRKNNNLKDRNRRFLQKEKEQKNKGNYYNSYKNNNSYDREYLASCEDFSNYKNNQVSENRKVRIAKRLADLGIASRREAEKIILQGRIIVNSVENKDLSLLVDYNDEIFFDGKKLDNKPTEIKIYLMNKPAGYVTTNFDPDGRKTIFELIPKKLGRLMTVGRLDINTEGLILLTNSGEAARVLELPATSLKRVYRVRVFGHIDLEQLKSLKNGITIDSINYGSFVVIVDRLTSTNSWLTIILSEGKNREIKKVLGHCNLKVTRLIRVQYGSYNLGDIPSGCIVESKIKFNLSYYKHLLTNNFIKNKNKYKNIHKNDLIN
jgi:23S rRNA pseudouridine2605 synthase